MGYKAKRYRLVWDDGEYAGLEVTMKPASIGQMMEMEQIGGLDPQKTSVAEIRPLIGMLAGLIVSWNVEDDDGQPVPADEDGITGQDIGMLTAIITEFGRRITAVDPTSPNGSPNGAEAVTPTPPIPAGLDLAGASATAAGSSASPPS